MASMPPAMLTFSQPPRAPARTPSGCSIKLGVVRAMASQHQMFERCHRAAEKLVAVVRKTNSLPPKPNGGTRDKPKE